MSRSDDSDSSSEIVPYKRKRRILPLLSSEDDSSLDSVTSYVRNDNIGHENVEWFDLIENQPDIIPFTSTYGSKKDAAEVQSCTKAEDFYGLFATDEIFENISIQTNIYVAQSMKSSKRLDKWIPTNRNEIKRFMGLFLWMGLVKLPSLKSYWSKDPLFAQTFPRKVMSRDRFEILLRMLHFTNNEMIDTANRLSKIQCIIDALNENFKKYYDPPEMFCIDESLIPFRGRIVFRQYLKQKRRRYGIKIFKLCCDYGYTYSFRIYTGKSIDKTNTPSDIVMDLCRETFHKGHTLCTDNWYTSLELANKLIRKDTHLIGTLRKHRKGNPNGVVTAKLKRGKCIGKENNNGITILKWKDKRDVLVLSTKHSVEMVNVQTKTGFRQKPKIIVDYNAGKTAIDLSDQMTAYSSPLRKTIKWYRKLAFELLLNTCVVNALFIFQDVTGQKISITIFRKKLAAALTQHSDEEIPIQATPKRVHRLEKKSGKAHQVRRYCVECYNTNAKLFDRKTARNLTKKVITFCGVCEAKPHLCLECFNKLH